MSLDFVKTKLRQLSYQDMKRLAHEISQQLWGADTKRVNDLAEALSSVPLDDASIADRDEEMLRQIFRRKMNISIHLLWSADGAALWEVSMPNSTKISAQAPTLRDAISQLLDILVARAALGR